MKIQYLGTGAAEGIPGVFCQCPLCKKAAKLSGREVRTRAGAIINNEILIDLTPDLYYHKLRYNLDLSRVKAVVVTHSHTDHFDSAELTRRSTADYCHIAEEKPLAVYGNEKVCRLGKEGLKLEFGQEENPSIRFYPIHPFDTWKVGEIRFTAIPSCHDGLEECLIYVIQDGESSILYGNDTGLLPQETYDRLKEYRFDLISLDCTFGPARSPVGAHMGFFENRQFLDELEKRGCLKETTRVLATHFSHNAGLLHQGLSQAGAQYGIEVAYDGLIWEKM